MSNIGVIWTNAIQNFKQWGTFQAKKETLYEVMEATNIYEVNPFLHRIGLKLNSGDKIRDVGKMLCFKDRLASEHVT